MLRCFKNSVLVAVFAAQCLFLAPNASASAPSVSDSSECTTSLSEEQQERARRDLLDPAKGLQGSAKGLETTPQSEVMSSAAPQSSAEPKAGESHNESSSSECTF
jgi:hypothetical protein